jgi:hypothetical protein
MLRAMNTSTFRRLGKSPNSGWDVYSIGIATPASFPTHIALPSKHFACLLSWNAERVSVAAIASLAERLLALGCVYFCCRGAGCERVHDVIDEVLAGDGSTNVTWLDVMTAWHDKDPVVAAIDFFLDRACPADRYLNECSTALAITIGDDFEVTSMELALAVKLRESPSDPPLQGARRQAARP